MAACACPAFAFRKKTCPGSVSVGEWAPTVRRGVCALPLRALQVLSPHVIMRKASCGAGVEALLFRVYVVWQRLMFRPDL